MARIEVDPAGVSAVRGTVRGDPATLRAVADTVAAATAAARAALGSQDSPLSGELDRFRLVHAHLLDAMAEAFTALGGGLDLAAETARAGELAAAAALGSLVPAVAGSAGGAGRPAG
jgi:hypothetical protein